MITIRNHLRVMEKKNTFETNAFAFRNYVNDECMCLVYGVRWMSLCSLHIEVISTNRALDSHNFAGMKCGGSITFENFWVWFCLFARISFYWLIINTVFRLTLSFQFEETTNLLWHNLKTDPKTCDFLLNIEKRPWSKLILRIETFERMIKKKRNTRRLYYLWSRWNTFKF